MTMTTTEAALLRAVLEEPAADDLRLILADWWEDHGQAGRAEFVRVGLELAGPYDPVRPSEVLRHATLRRREDYLIEMFGYRLCDGSCGPDWKVAGAKKVPPTVEVTFWRGAERFDCTLTFRRGLIASVALPLDAYLAHAEALFRAHPIEAVTLICRVPAWTSFGYDRFPPLCGWGPTLSYAQEDEDHLARLPDAILAALRGHRTGLDGWYSAQWRFYDSEDDARAALSAACVAHGRGLAGLPAL